VLANPERELRLASHKVAIAFTMLAIFFAALFLFGGPVHLSALAAASAR